MPLYLSLTMLWLSSDPLLCFVLSLTLKPRALPFLSSVLERQQSQLPLGGRLWLGGLAQAEWLIGNVFFVFLFFFVGQLWEGSSFFFKFIYLFLILYVFPELFQHIRSVVRAPKHKHTPSHTWNEWERVRCWIKQTHLASVRKTPLIFKQPFSVN